jgi:hypothetical protein
MVCRARSTGKDDSATPLTNLGGQQRGLVQFKLKFTPDPNAPQPARSVQDSAMQHSASQSAHHGSGGGWGPPSAGPGSIGSPRISRGSAAGGVAAAGSVASDEYGAARHPYQDVLQGSMRNREDIDTESVQDDPTMRSVNSKVSLAKQAMQQLTAELAELGGGAGIDPVPPPQVQSSRSIKSAGGPASGSFGGGDAGLNRTKSAAAGGYNEREHGAPSSTTSSSRLASFGHHEQHQHHHHAYHAGAPESQSPHSSIPRPPGSIGSPGGRGSYDTPRGGGSSSLRGSIRVSRGFYKGHAKRACSLITKGGGVEGMDWHTCSYCCHAKSAKRSIFSVMCLHMLSYTIGLHASTSLAGACRHAKGLFVDTHVVIKSCYNFVPLLPQHDCLCYGLAGRYCAGH